jgi:hypothetical protein
MLPRADKLELITEATLSPDAYIEQVFEVMGRAHWHTFQILTKRPIAVATQHGYTICAIAARRRTSRSSSSNGEAAPRGPEGDCWTARRMTRCRRAMAAAI